MNTKNTKTELWGLGIEHEMHIFHKPDPTKKTPIQGFIIFNSEEVVQRLLKEKENGSSILNDNEYNWLKKVPFETSGRLCNGKWVIKRVPFKMPEFISFNPFFKVSDKNRNIENMVRLAIETKNLFISFLLRDKKTRQLVEKYGELVEYPTGFSRHIYLPTKIKNGKYIFETEIKENKKKTIQYSSDYTGSYHVTFTLPHSDKTTEKEFIEMHQNFANQLQWLEPLMIPAYFSGDEYSPGSIQKRVRGSFRVMIIGWGNFAGSDVRLFNKGIGRYAKTHTYWRDDLNFYEVDKLKPCIEPSPSAIAENGITSLSSDFRTFGALSENRPDHRVSGLKMTKPNGIEFRIFDHFLDYNITNLIYLISLVAENSRTHKTTSYVYKNKVWIDTLHLLMENGYKTILPIEYIQLLRKHLNLKIKTTSQMADDVFENVYMELVNKNWDGKWMSRFLSINPKFINLQKINPKKILTVIKNPKINRISWTMAFIFKCHKNKKYMKSFNYIVDIMKQEKIINIEDMKYIIINLFGKSWKNDIVDICYFIENMGIIKIYKTDIGEIEKIEYTLDGALEKFSNFNYIIDFIYKYDIYKYKVYLINSL